MARYTRAQWEPINRSSPPMTPTCVVVHSNAAHSYDLLGWWDNNPDGLMSHFQDTTSDQTVPVFQYVDTNNEAYANVAANADGISWESENHFGVDFDVDRWDARQAAELVAGLAWCCKTHNIKPELCTDGVHGLGYHEQFPQWTTPSHHCPGSARVAQFIHEIIPAVAAAVNQEEPDLTPDQDLRQKHIEAMLAVLTGIITKDDLRTWQTKVIEQQTHDAVLRVVRKVGA